MLSLTYTSDFQIKLLANLLSDKKWFGEVASSIHLSDFDMSPCRLVFEIARTYYEKFGDIPPSSVIQIEVERAIQNPMATYETVVQEQEYESLAYVMKCVSAINQSDSDRILQARTSRVPVACQNVATSGKRVTAGVA